MSRVLLCLTFILLLSTGSNRTHAALRCDLGDAYQFTFFRGGSSLQLTPAAKDELSSFFIGDYVDDEDSCNSSFRKFKPGFGETQVAEDLLLSQSFQIPLPFGAEENKYNFHSYLLRQVLRI